MGKRARRRGDEPGQRDAGEERAAGDDAEASDGASATGAKRRPGGDSRLTEVSYLIAEADLLLHLYRWIVLMGEVPKAQDWLADERWPHPDAAIETFGSWEAYLKTAEVGDAPLLARARRHEEEAKRMAARERDLERESERAADLRRRVEVATRRREEADAARDDQERRATRAQARLHAAEERAQRAETALAEQRATAQRAAEAPRAPGAAGEPGEEWVAAHEATMAELDSVRAHREELLDEVAVLREAAEQDRRALARLSALVAEEGSSEPPSEDGAGEGLNGDAPVSALEAVRRARAEAEHLVFTDAAEESAADSPYRRPADLLETLRRLDRLAGLHASHDGFGTSLGQAARDMGLSWKHGVSDTARSRKPHAYAVTHDGHRLELGPHVAVGSGSGAGYVARVYLAVEDGTRGLARGLYVGHVGRHLPDTTT